MSGPQVMYKPTLSAMLPAAGLFLPETLHRREGHWPGLTETDGPRPKYFQRMAARPKHEARDADESMVSIPVLGSSEDLDAFPSIATAFQFAHFVSSSSKPSSDSHALASLLRRVQQDVSEANRLYLSAAVTNFLDAWPDRKVWVDNIFVDTRGALNDIGQYIETFRVAGDDGGATGLKRRFEWISGHQKRLSTKQQLLSACHSSLVTAINIMQTVELCGVTTGSWQDPIYEAPVQPWVKNDDANALRGPYSRREWRLSQKNLSASNIHLSESEQDNMETRSVNSLPAELPGSTPDDLANGARIDQLPSPLVHNSCQRSSQRRSCFERKRENEMALNTATGPSSYSYSSLPDSLRIRSPLDHAPTRNSFDQFPFTASTMPDVSRASLDGARPHSHPVRSRGVTLPGTTARTSTDFVAPLPTVDEKIVERNDSTTSTTAVVTMPQVARRYYPNHVYIRKQPGKHRSLPSELPHLQSQSLLTDDLANWMVPPSAQSDKLKSIEWDTPSGFSSPSISIASCPVAAQVQPVESYTDSPMLENQYEEVSGITSEPGSMIVPNEEDHTSQHVNDELQIPSNASSVESVQSGTGERDYAVSVRSYASSLARKPVPVTARIHSSISFITKDATLPTEEEDVLSVAPSSECTSPPLPSTSTPTADDTELSQLQQKLLQQAYVQVGNASDSTETEEVVATKTPEPTTTELALLSPSSQDKEIVPDVTSPPTAKPMSAQAKRRAAHQRRMELAFGGN
ncbi:hypothetical protein CC86DRAFT_455585 [Ophiobolus disseminans]|uniref:Uncharacterized protein n=1 Tax=Ophiobolus disseminans TaxID=1469910 RepID=A0A6A7A380_9PLEO|nr:hypothetical protein CC86DRAFT_455585 [Ophiobolus disseminans]